MIDNRNDYVLATQGGEWPEETPRCKCFDAAYCYERGRLLCGECLWGLPADVPEEEKENDDDH